MTMVAVGAPAHLLFPIALAPSHQPRPKLPTSKTTAAAAGGVDATSKTKLPRATPIFFFTISTKTTTAAGGVAATSKTKLPSRAIKCASSLENRKPIISTSKKTLYSNLSKALVVSASAAAGLFLHLHPILTLAGGSGNGNGNFSGGGGGGGGSGGGGDGNGGFWSKVLFPAAYAKEDESQAQEWDSHGLPADVVVKLKNLNGFKRYKVSDIIFFDLRQHTMTGVEDSLFEMMLLRPCEIYTKAQLQNELESLEKCGMFEKVDLKVKTNPDGTINVTIPFTESTWKSADKFRCINVGLLQEKDSKRRVDRARPCLLPKPVYKEVRQMLMEQKKVSARLLQRIRDRVQKWYHDEGYQCAVVVNFTNLDTKEVVCEVVEGDITKLEIQFQDKLGNVIERNTLLPVVRKLSKQLRQGHVFNIEAGKQALMNINSLELFSTIDIDTCPDEMNGGGVIVKVKLKELEQKTAGEVVPQLESL